MYYLKDQKKVNRSGVNAAQKALYDVMKLRHDMGISFSRSDLMEIYNTYTSRKTKWYDGRDKAFLNKLSDEQIYNNASAWLNRSIVSLVRNGWVGLTFEKGSKMLDNEKLIEVMI